MSDTAAKPPVPSFEIKGNATAPFIYFDHGAIILELVARTILPDGSSTKSEVVATCHLRCSPDGARDLHNAIERTFLLVTPTAGRQAN